MSKNGTPFPEPAPEDEYDPYRDAPPSEYDAELGGYLDEPEWDGDQCPNCGRLETIRIDTLYDDDPVIWICQCEVCGETFEALA